MHASEIRSCRQIYTASIYIYIYMYINCLHVPCMGSRSYIAIYIYAAMCLLQGGPTVWACVPGWLVVLQCLLGHVAAMVGAVDAHRCHMGRKPLKALHCILYISEICLHDLLIFLYMYIFIYLHDLLIFLYVFLVAFHARTVLLGPKYN